MGVIARPDAHVSVEERRRWARQVATLEQADIDDEGTPEWRAAVIESTNEWRARHGVPPLREWWETKGEIELHRRARALGLLRDVR